MPIVVALLLICLIWGLISLFEWYKKQSFIASIIDGTTVDSNHISEEFQNLVNQLKDPGKLKYRNYDNSVKLPDGQIVCTLIKEGMDIFQRKSELNFEPSKTEWEILRGIVKKLVSPYI